MTTITSISVLKKNSSAASRPSATPTGTGRLRWRTSNSSRQTTINGRGTRTLVIKWSTARFVKTKGENPNTRPPKKAAGVQLTQRRSIQNIARAVAAGPRVDATFNAATGPNSHVTGASGIPRTRTLVFESMLMPVGWKSAVE